MDGKMFEIHPGRWVMKKCQNIGSRTNNLDSKSNFSLTLKCHMYNEHIILIDASHLHVHSFACDQRTI